MFTTTAGWPWHRGARQAAAAGLGVLLLGLISTAAARGQIAKIVYRSSDNTAVCSPLAAPAGTCLSGTWRPIPPYPIPIIRPAVVEQNGLLYSFGGATSGAVTVANAYTYDPGTENWLAIAPLPQPLYAASAVTDGRYLYIVNGIGGSYPGVLYRYDPGSDSYTTLAVPPVGSIDQAAVYLAGRIYRIAGSHDNHVDVYDVASGQWAPPGTIADYPSRAEGLAALAYGGYIYAVGGDWATAKTYRYDPAHNEWADAPIADLPQPRETMAQGLLDGRWLLAGGFSGTARTDTVLALDLSDPTGAWTNAAPLPAPLAFVAGATAGQAFYTVGGQTDDPQAPVTTLTLQYAETACPTGTPTATPTPCPPGTFSDVHTSDYFYTPVQYLAQHGIIAGYGDCTFRPYSATTRAQLVKLVILGFPTPVPTPPGGAYTFADVPPANPFFAYVEAGAARGTVSGYTCGGPGEPCDSANRPYFRPYASVSRGQLSKVVVLAAGWPLQRSPEGRFADVLPGTAFYPYVETAVQQGILSGYACGGPGEPCDAQARPYFRPGAPATRGQIAKIVYLAGVPPAR